MSTTFASLPFEIRLQIWALCVPYPRIIVFKLDCSRKPDLYSQNAQPILLSINHESRAYLLASNGGGYVLIRVFDTHVAFHPSKDSVGFLEGSALRNKVLDFNSQRGETMRITRLAAKEKMLTYWLEDSEHGDRLRDWLMDHVDVLGIAAMDGLSEGDCSSTLSKITELWEQVDDDGEGAPWVLSEFVAFDKYPFCRELVKKGQQ